MPRDTHSVGSKADNGYAPWVVAGLVLVVALAAAPSCSEERTIAKSSDTVYYSDIRYIFDVKCLNAGCHAGESPAAGLSMAGYEGILSGSENGPVVTAGDPEASLLYRTLAYTSAPEMPIGERLPRALVDSVGRWIQGGLFENR
jgi:hypothetical protein